MAGEENNGTGVQPGARLYALLSENGALSDELPRAFQQLSAEARAGWNALALEFLTQNKPRLPIAQNAASVEPADAARQDDQFAQGRGREDDGSRARRPCWPGMKQLFERAVRPIISRRSSGWSGLGSRGWRLTTPTAVHASLMHIRASSITVRWHCRAPGIHEWPGRSLTRYLRARSKPNPKIKATDATHLRFPESWPSSGC